MTQWQWWNLVGDVLGTGRLMWDYGIRLIISLF